MKRRLGCWLSLALSYACSSAASHDRVHEHETQRETQHERETPRQLRHLNESFALADNTCAIESARERVTDVKAQNGRRPSADLRVLELSFRCRTASDRPISFEQAMPKDAIVLLVSQSGVSKAPSTRTWLHAVSPEHVIFELGADEHALPLARRYDAQSGALKARPQQERFELWLTGSSLSTRIRLTKALDQQPLEQSLDAFVTQLVASDDSDSELAQVRKLHRLTLEITQAKTLQVDDVSAEGPLHIVTWSYRDQARPFAREIPRLLLEFAPTGRPAAPYEFARARELGALRTLLRCGERERNVHEAARKAFADAPTQTSECNVAGVLWPTPCDQLASTTLREALEARAGCMGDALSQLEKRAENLPSDLQITLRRGRGESALDRSPRFTLALFGSGATVFHAQGAIGAGRNDGRTSTGLLAALMRAVDDLAWFERRGGGWGDECDPRAEDAHVLTVHAREHERMVMDRPGCRGPFSARELNELFDLVERVGFVSAWTMPRPDYADRAARIWTVSAE